MPDLSPEPKMMRSQQDKDTPEHLSEDETAGKPTVKADSDPESGRDREAAKRGDAQYANEQMDAIFEENGRGDEGARQRSEDDLAADVATDGQAGLTQGGRSRT